MKLNKPLVFKMTQKYILTQKNPLGSSKQSSQRAASKKRIASAVAKIFAPSSDQANAEAEAEAKHREQVEAAFSKMQGKATFRDPMKGKRSPEEQARHEEQVARALGVMQHRPRDFRGEFI